MEARGAESITTALAMKWVTLIGRQPSWSIRLTDVRCFAQHLAHFDPLTEVPPQDAVSPARRAKPYIYTDAEITALLAAALSLPPANALRRWTYHCLFGLIAVAGLRHSEALDLRQDDVDLDQGILTIRETKFGKSRLVRSMPRRSPCCRTMPRDATRISSRLVAPISLSPSRAADCCTNTCTGCSGSCRDRSVCGSGGSAMVRGFTIFVTVSPSRP